jgi:hypothetical protein
MLVLLLVSLLSGILAVAGLPSAVDAVMFPLSLLQLASLHAVAGFAVFASIPAFDCIHTACVGAPVVAYNSAVACVPAVACGHDIDVSLMLLVAGVTVVASDCCCLLLDCGRHSCCCWGP